MPKDTHAKAAEHHEAAAKEGLNKGLAQGRRAWRLFTGHSTG